MSDKTSPNRTMSLISALELAKGYADLGHCSYGELAKGFEGTSSDPAALPLKVCMQAIAAAMVFSFAIEIYLKALAFQRTENYPNGHMLRELVNTLPTDVREKIAVYYKLQVDQKTNFLKLKFQMAVHKDGEEPVHEAAQEVGRVADRWPGDTFDEAIELASPLFVKLRYLYEEVTDGFTAEIDFRWLIYLLEAVRHQIHENAAERSKRGITFTIPQSEKS